MKMRRLLPTLILLLSGVGCDEEPATPLAEEGLREYDADAVVWGMTNYLTRNGVQTGFVIADSAFVVGDSALVYMEGMEMTIHSDLGVERARVTADRGRLNQRTEEMTAQGNVFLVVPAQDVRIQSSELHWDPIRGEIWSDSVTSAVINGAPADGTCFRSDLEFTSWSVCQPRGQIPSTNPAGGPPAVAVPDTAATAADTTSAGL